MGLIANWQSNLLLSTPEIRWWTSAAEQDSICAPSQQLTTAADGGVKPPLRAFSICSAQVAMQNLLQQAGLQNVVQGVRIKIHFDLGIAVQIEFVGDDIPDNKGV